MIGAILAATAGVSVDEYERAVATFYAEAQHLTLKKPYSFSIYQPMVELLRYLEANGFTVYIVSGGDRDFMRPMTVDYYGIPPERVIGTAFGLTYDAESERRAVRHDPGLLRRQLERRPGHAALHAEEPEASGTAGPPRRRHRRAATSRMTRASRRRSRSRRIRRTASRW